MVLDMWEVEYRPDVVGRLAVRATYELLSSVLQFGPASPD